MAGTALAAVAWEGPRIQMQEIPIPDVSYDDGLLQVESVLVCGTDWPLYQKTRHPRILGHHITGVVKTLGDVASQRWGVVPGDRVLLEEYLPCGQCRSCRSGEYRMCPVTDLWTGTHRYGYTPLDTEPGLFGGYAQYTYLHPRAILHKIPHTVTPEQAALALPISNGLEWTGLEGGLGVGSTVVIEGPGQLGLSCVLAAKAAGAKRIIVSGVGRDSPRLELASQLGADMVVNVELEDLREVVKEATDGEYADLVVDCASGGAHTIEMAVQTAKRKGTVILAGYKHAPILEFDTDLIIQKSLTIKGVRGHLYHSVEQAIALIQANPRAVDYLTTHRFDLSRVDEALRTVGSGANEVISATVFPWR